MRYFPIFVDLGGRLAVVGGAGEAALQKVRLLLKSEARIRVVGAPAHADIAALAEEGRIELADRRFEPADLDGAALAYGAHGDRDLDEAFSRAARERRVPVNVVDAPALSDFITPALVDRDPVTVAIGSEGAAPVLARMIKARIEAMLPPHLGAVARIAAPLRRRVARTIAPGAPRRSFWRRVLTAGWQAGAGTARAQADALLAAGGDRDTGEIWLVGAGPGDPELMTLKARRVLDEADVVVHDRLVDPRVLELARREARFVAVGKTPGGASTPQSKINEILIEETRAGRRVVRLKGGDPLVFGRADEELAALRAAGIEAGIVPGITAASAAAAAAGLSLTSRGRNQSVALITARGAEGPAEHDWRALADPGAAFAVYMGVGQARFLQGRLLVHAADAGTPVTIVENASRPDERVLTGTLGSLAQIIEANSVTSPAILLIGFGRDADALELPRTAAGGAA